MSACRICGTPLGHYFEFVKKADAHDSCVQVEQARAEGAAEEREACVAELGTLLSEYEALGGMDGQRGAAAVEAGIVRLKANAIRARGSAVEGAKPSLFDAAREFPSGVLVGAKPCEICTALRAAVFCTRCKPEPEGAKPCPTCDGTRWVHFSDCGAPPGAPYADQKPCPDCSEGAQHPWECASEGGQCICGLEGASKAPECAGPFVDARDCPVHSADVLGAPKPNADEGARDLAALGREASAEIARLKRGNELALEALRGCGALQALASGEHGPLARMVDEAIRALGGKP